MDVAGASRRAHTHARYATESGPCTVCLALRHLAYAVAPLERPPRPRMLSVAEAAWRGLPKDLTKNRPDLMVGFDWWVQEFRRAFETKSWEQR